MEYSAYLITCKTNMHVGSGDTTFGVVDNLVQRDPVTNHPTIHSPSLKGALKEHFKGITDKKIDMTYIFGSDNASSTQQQGNYRFFSAHLLSIPVRSDNKPFYMATTTTLIENFMSTLKQFRIASPYPDLDNLIKLKPEKKKPFIGDTESASIEDYTSVTSPEMKDLKTILGPNLALFHEEDFKAITEDLPVIARNYLVNGESKNLWYEEIVPYETRFFFVIGKGEQQGDVFDEAFQEGMVQIGANATIGYGYTTIQKLNCNGETK